MEDSVKLTNLGVVFLTGIATALPLVGCSWAPSDDIASNREAVVINPGDTENWANLTLALPTGTCLPGLTCGRPLALAPSLTLDGTSVSVGASVRLKPGEHTLSANGNSIKLTLNPGMKRTFVLPVARSKCTPAPLPTVVPTDFGKTPSPTNVPCPTVAVGAAPASVTTGVTINNLDPYYSANCGSVLTQFGHGAACSAYAPYTVYSVRISIFSGGACMNLSPPINAQTACNSSTAGDFSWLKLGAAGSSLTSADQAFIPDTYTVTIDSSTTQKFTLAEGDLKEVALSLPVVGTVPSLFKTNITFAEPRSLPTAARPAITSSCSGDRSYTIPDTASGTLNLKAYADSSCVYTLTASGVGRTITQTTTTTFKLYRIDVNNVTVTREDGSTYVTSGTYELYQDGSRVAGPYATNTGIDAFPGTYELVISYSTADGPKTQRQTITL